jgi:hypothetical protein
MRNKARLLTCPTLEVISLSRLESTKTAPSPWDTLYPKQGRSKQRGNELQTTLRVERSPIEWVLAIEETPSVIRVSDRPSLTI